MIISKRLMVVFAATAFLGGCQTPEQMAEKEAGQSAKAEAQAAEQVAKAEKKLMALEEKLPDGFERVVGDPLLETVSNTTVTGVSSSDSSWEFTIFRDPDGMMKGVSTNGSNTSEDKGKWWIEADLVCSQWSSWLDGKQICNRVYSNGDYFMTIGKDGAISDGKKLKWTNEPGNVANL